LLDWSLGLSSLQLVTALAFNPKAPRAFPNPAPKEGPLRAIVLSDINASAPQRSALT